MSSHTHHGVPESLELDGGGAAVSELGVVVVVVVVDATVVVAAGTTTTTLVGGGLVAGGFVGGGFVFGGLVAGGLVGGGFVGGGFVRGGLVRGGSVGRSGRVGLTSGREVVAGVLADVTALSVVGTVCSGRLTVGREEPDPPEPQAASASTPTKKSVKRFTEQRCLHIRREVVSRDHPHPDGGVRNLTLDTRRGYRASRLSLAVALASRASSRAVICSGCKVASTNSTTRSASKEEREKMSM
jgi:hypothetical protein